MEMVCIIIFYACLFYMCGVGFLCNIIFWDLDDIFNYAKIGAHSQIWIRPDHWSSCLMSVNPSAQVLPCNSRPSIRKMVRSRILSSQLGLDEALTLFIAYSNYSWLAIRSIYEINCREASVLLWIILIDLIVNNTLSRRVVTMSK